jgi:hypothetical protein
MIAVVTRDEAARPAIRRDHLMEVHPRAKQTERISDQRGEQAATIHQP